MNKKILSLLLASAMLLSSGAAMAEVGSTGVTKNVEITSEAQKLAAFAKLENLTVVTTEDDTIEVKQSNGDVIYLNTIDSVYYKNDGTEIKLEDIKEGDTLIAFTHAYKPTPAIYPPVYSPEVIICVDEKVEMSIAVSTFSTDEDSKGVINLEGDLIVHLPEDSTIDLSEPKNLLVFYNRTTMSIPPQAPAEKVVEVAGDPVIADTEEPTEVVEEATEKYVSTPDLKVTSISEATFTASEQTDDDSAKTYTYSTENTLMFYNDGTEVTELKENDIIKAYVKKDSTDNDVVIDPVAIIVTKDGAEGFVDVSSYTKVEDLENAYRNLSNTLVVNSEEIKENTDYIVFYTITTRSLPPQTTPTKLVELDAVETFTDVSTADEFYDSIMAVVNKGLFAGVSDTEFNPTGNMTRAMFVTVLGRLDGIAVKDACVTGFEDAAGDQYYSSYVAWANENGIVKGYDDGTFKPDKAVTREEAMQIFWNYSNFKGISSDAAARTALGYADAAEISDWASDAAQWNAANNFLVENADSNIRPKTDITRAEAAHAMDVLSDLIK